MHIFFRKTTVSHCMYSVGPCSKRGQFSSPFLIFADCNKIAFIYPTVGPHEVLWSLLPLSWVSCLHLSVALSSCQSLMKRCKVSHSSCTMYFLIYCNSKVTWLIFQIMVAQSIHWLNLFKFIENQISGTVNASYTYTFIHHISLTLVLI